MRVPGALPGLRPYDRPHTCESCARGLSLPGTVGGDLPSGLPAWGGLATTGDLVSVVGDWKYHGLRGLVWALALPLLRATRERARKGRGPLVLVPVPLHPGRRRRRGFNQAELLAQLVGRAADMPVRPDLLRRHFNTGQQAKISHEAQRRSNVRGAFTASPGAAGVRNIWLVDDLVTSGATAEAAAAGLRAGGAEVAGILGVGLAPRLIRERSGPVDMVAERT
ncbi:ComF family protein [bacterium]|nr:ComF family protein [bacterium]